MTMSDDEKEKLIRMSLDCINDAIGDSPLGAEVLHAAALSPDEHATVCSSLMMMGDMCMSARGNAKTDHERSLADNTFAEVAKVLAKFMGHKGDPVENMKTMIKEAKDFSFFAGSSNVGVLKN